MVRTWLITGVVHDQVDPLHRARRGVGDPGTHDDRRRRAGRGEVHDPEAVRADEVDVLPEPDPGVERLGPVPVRDRQHDHFDLELHDLISYPLLDVVASLLDAREEPGIPARTLQIFNTTLSALAAVALGVAALSGTGAVLFTFGVWAIVSGIAQFAVAVRRRTALGRQWPMLIAGALSVIAGGSYLPVALSDTPGLDMLVLYTAAGGVFFVLQALALAWRQRRQTVDV